MSTPERMHLSGETLAEFVDGTLDASARKRVIEHMGVCSDCRSLAIGTWDAAAGHESRAAMASPSRMRPYYWVAAAVVIAIAAVPLAERFSRRGRAVTALSSASERVQFRALEARTSVIDIHKPLAPLMRSGRSSVSDDPQFLPIVAAASQVAASTEQEDSAAARHLYGVSRLLLNDYEGAIAGLGAAAAELAGSNDLKESTSRLTDASLLTDLAAAYHSRFRHTRSAHDAMMAVQFAERAWQIEKLEATAWNRALAMEDLGTPSAVGAWRDYLSLDSDSSWTIEARDRLRKLEQQGRTESPEALRRTLIAAASTGDDAALASIGERHAQDMRTLLEEALLPDAVAGRERAATVRRIASALAKTAAIDPAESAVAVEEAARSPVSAVKNDLSTGYADYRRARDAYRGERIAEALHLFTRAADRLQDVDPAASLRSRFYASACLFYQGQYAASRASLQAILRAIDYGTERSALAGHCYWMLGLLSMSEGNPLNAVESYESALSRFTTIREIDNALAVRNLLAEAYSCAGDDDRADRSRQAALDAIRLVPASRRFHVVFSEAASAALRAGLPLAAAVLLNDVVARAESAGNPRELADALLNRAMLEMRQAKSELAARDLDHAARVVARIPDASVREMTEADLILARARLSPQTASLDELQRVEALWERRGHHARRAAVIAARGDAFVARGDAAAAEVCYEKALQVLEQFRLGVDDDRESLSLVPSPRNLCEHLLRRALTRNDALRALMYADRVNVFRLNSTDPNLPRIEPITSVRIREIQQNLPERAAVIAYYASGDGIFAWRIGRTNIRVAFEPLPAADLAALTAAHSEALFSGKRSDDASVGSKLFAITMGFLRDELPSLRMLYLVPDGSLRNVVFAALRTGDDTHLVTTHEIVTLPALATLRLRPRSDHPDHGATRALVVVRGRPSERLPLLEGAIREARAVASRYPAAEVLEDGEATKSRVGQSAKTADVIHVAAHAAVNDVYPRFSFVRLSDERGLDEPLYAHDITQFDLRNDPIVTLAACRSGRASSRTAHNRNALVEAFLLAGATSVVAAYDDVPDTAPSVVLRVHELLAGGMNAPAALRVAQLEFMRRRPDDRQWALFHLITTELERGDP